MHGKHKRENANLHLSKSIIINWVFRDPWLCGHNSSAAVLPVKEETFKGNAKLQWGFLRHNFGTEELHFFNWFMS